VSELCCVVMLGEKVFLADSPALPSEESRFPRRRSGNGEPRSQWDNPERGGHRTEFQKILRESR